MRNYTEELKELVQAMLDDKETKFYMDGRYPFAETADGYNLQLHFGSNGVNLFDSIVIDGDYKKYAELARESMSDEDRSRKIEELERQIAELKGEEK